MSLTIRRIFVLALLVAGVLLISAQITLPATAQGGNPSQPATLAAPPPTNTPRDTQPQAAPATNTPRVTATPSLTLVPSRTPSPTRTLRPSATPTATRTPRPTNTPEPTLVIMGTYLTPVNTPATAIPFAMPTPVPNGDDIVTVLLLGSDTITEGAAARTDVIIVVAINRTAGSVSMLHFPRDLYVYAPNWTMTKINTVFNQGNHMYGPGGGAKLMKETMLYNFGLKIDFYARVDFVKFQDIIFKLGGLEITVDCAMQGHKLKSPDLEYDDPESWELYTINIGVHKLDPYSALWYVRARGSSSDLDRGRRQMEVLRAIWRQARNAGLIEQLTGLWPEFQKIVETDMQLTDLLGLVPMALSLDLTAVQRINVLQGVQLEQWYTSDAGQFAWLPLRDGWQKAIQNLLLPPPRNRLGGDNPTVEIGAALPVQGYDRVAADRLSWEGFNVKLIGMEGLVNRTNTVIIDYTGGSKPTSLEALRRLLRVPKGNVLSQPDPNATVDFRVEMGRDYGQSCLLAIPTETN